MQSQDPQLRAWAAKMLPTLKDHKMRVKRMHDDLEAKGRPASTSR